MTEGDFGSDCGTAEKYAAKLPRTLSIVAMPSPLVLSHPAHHQYRLVLRR